MTPEAVFAQVADRPGAVWLDGAEWSLLCWDPVEVVTEARGWPEAGRARTGGAGGGPFAGGVVGYVGFGAGHAVEAVPRGGPTPEPDVFLGRYEGGARYRGGRWEIGGSRGFVRDAERLIGEARALPSPDEATARTATTLDRRAYEALVERIRALISAGDCYQVNLTRAVHVAGAGDPFAAYRRLRRSPARYGAFVRVDASTAVLSNSPELLLEVRGRDVRSIPIKGTRRRSPEPAEDARLARELWESDKDRAELTMIVDLVRNDLGRVARTGTVTVGERVVTSHPTVHHTSWEVRAELAAGRDAWDALAGAFPPGSVTGAPKVRACQRIAELEPDPRGVYCGAIGYVADGGDATWSVAIRVAVFSGADARYHVGGGIVVDSEPGAEWDETVGKEAALAAALLTPRGGM